MSSFFHSPSKIVTLLTDFGSFYPSQMKGVILSRIPEAVLVDIAHDVPPQDIRAGAFLLMCAARYFPPGTLHLAVVDPTVGTERLGIVVRSGDHFFVGPDNGLLMPAAKSLGTPEAHMISLQFESSPTFHGRDVFAPVAAMLVAGEDLESIGPRVEPVDLDFGSSRRVAGGVEARVLYVDRFGNLILNMKEIPPGKLRLAGRALKKVRTYAEAEGIEPLITIGGHGLAEVAVNRGSAADLFGLCGDCIVLEETDCSE
jgi:S-adenosylmethionine hydrolase